MQFVTAAILLNIRTQNSLACWTVMGLPTSQPDSTAVSFRMTSCAHTFQGNSAYRAMKGYPCWRLQIMLLCERQQEQAKPLATWKGQFGTPQPRELSQNIRTVPVPFLMASVISISSLRQHNSEPFCRDELFQMVIGLPVPYAYSDTNLICNKNLKANQ